MPTISQPLFSICEDISVNKFVAVTGVYAAVNESGNQQNNDSHETISVMKKIKRIRGK